MVTSQVTEAGRGSAECLTVVRDSETDLDTTIKVCDDISSESCAWRNVISYCIILFCVVNRDIV